MLTMVLRKLDKRADLFEFKKTPAVGGLAPALQRLMSKALE